MTAELRDVRPGDEALFDRVAPDVFDHPVECGQLARYLATPGHHLIVAIVEGQIVGQIAAVVHYHPDGRPTELYVDEVGVSPAFQRQGIARRLLDAMLALGRDLGCREAWVATEHDNDAARALYEGRSEPAGSFVMYVLELD
jgi:aminoglycoside 6'-N-acetyltransferase I